MWVDQGLVYIGPIISSLNSKLCVSLPSIFLWLTAVEVSAIWTSPFRNNYIITKAGFHPLPSQVSNHTFKLKQRFNPSLGAIPYQVVCSVDQVGEGSIQCVNLD